MPGGRPGGDRPCPAWRSPGRVATRRPAPGPRRPPTRGARAAAPARPEEAAMAFMTESERAFARAISELALCNPFLPERIEAERRALGARFVPTGPVWHKRPLPLDLNPNVARLAGRATALADKLRERLGAGADPGSDRALYEDLV